jgi:hypothetical protein
MAHIDFFYRQRESRFTIVSPFALVCYLVFCGIAQLLGVRRKRRFGDERSIAVQTRWLEMWFDASVTNAAGCLQ